MPNLSTLAVTLGTTISGSAGKSVSGSDYKGPSQAANISRSFAYSTSNSNTASLGADEFISYIQTIPSGQGATINLASIQDYLLQNGVNLARIKGYELNLMSEAQDPTFGTNCSGVVINGPALPPVQNAAVGSTTGGSMAAGTYYYVITAETAAGESTVFFPSGSTNQQSATVSSGSTGSVSLSWNVVPNATGYKIYRSTTPGSGTTTWFTTPALITTIGSGSTVTYTDTAASASAGAPPAINTAVVPTMFLFNETTGLSGKVLYNGDVTTYATPSASGLVVGSNPDVYVQNLDSSNPAHLQVTFVGGTT